MKAIELKATGYDWNCPCCGRQNYQEYQRGMVNCPRCRRVFSVSRVLHGNEADKIDRPKETDSTVMLVASAYTFRCPNCGTDQFIGRSQTQVKCKACRCTYTVGEMTHTSERVVVVNVEKQAPDPILTCRQLRMF